MKLKNTYFLLRHGEALSNVKNLNSSWPEPFENPMTEAGVAMIERAAEVLRTNHAKHGRNIDMIFSSDLLRTKQTAEIISEAMDVPVTYDVRLREIDFGSLNGQPHDHIDGARGMKELPRGSDGESYESVQDRMYSLVKDLEQKHEGKHILIVSHQASLWLLENKLKGISIADAIASKQPRITRGELREINV